MNETEKQTAAKPDNAPIIEVNSMHKWYGDFHVLSDINLKVALGERIVICGPSGSGKSTLIRCINRLEEHQRGQIIVNGTELTNDIKNIEKVRAEVGMVFQHFNLFPHLTILENLTLGPIWVRKTPKKEEAVVLADVIAVANLPWSTHFFVVEDLLVAVPNGVAEGNAIEVTAGDRILRFDPGAGFFAAVVFEPAVGIVDFGAKVGVQHLLGAGVRVVEGFHQIRLRGSATGGQEERKGGGENQISHVVNRVAN